jgi:hypothetical protein
MSNYAIRHVKKGRWYLVDTKYIKRPKIMRIDFRSKFDVLTFIHNKKKNNLRWDCLSSKSVIRLNIPFKKKTSPDDDMEYVVIYKYPADCITHQERKSFRTKYRWWEKRNPPIQVYDYPEDCLSLKTRKNFRRSCRKNLKKLSNAKNNKKQTSNRR